MADYQYITLTGTIIPDTSSILEDVQNEYKAAFGTDLDVSPSTPQGVLIAAETLSRSNMLINNAALANQINPNIAGGIFLDAIMALTGSTRAPATYTFVPNCTLGGVAGTFIAAGAQAKNSSGDVFATTADATIGVGGTVVVPMQAIVPGPIPATTGTITQVVTSILGWETVTNTSIDASLGTIRQSDGAARIYRRQTLAKQGIALPEAIISALYNIDGVTSVGFAENYTDSTIVYAGKTLVPHSIYVIVNNVSDALRPQYEINIANALLSSKSMGCAYNGSIAITVTAPISLQPYTVNFDYAETVPVAVEVTIRAGYSTTDPVAAVKQAILDYAAGNIPNDRGLQIGVEVSSFELSGAVNYYFPGIFVTKVQTQVIGSGDPLSSDAIPITFSQIAQILSGNINVVQVS